MIYISSAVVLSTDPRAAFNADNPVIGYLNKVTVGNIVADSEAAGAPALFLANPSTSPAQAWQGIVDTEQYVTVTLDGLADVDYVGIAGHNFYTTQTPVTIEGATALVLGVPDWAELVAEVIPGKDGPLLFRFPAEAYIGIRIKLGEGSAAPRATVLYVGKLLALPRRIYVDHKPMPFNLKSNTANGVSDMGHFLGRLVLSEMMVGSVAQKNVTPQFYRSEIEPWRKSGVTRPFFFAWRPDSYPDEVAYCWGTSDMVVSNQRNNGMVEFSFALQGVT